MISNEDNLGGNVQRDFDHAAYQDAREQLAALVTDKCLDCNPSKLQVHGAAVEVARGQKKLDVVGAELSEMFELCRGAVRIDHGNGNTAVICQRDGVACSMGASLPGIKNI